MTTPLTVLREEAEARRFSRLQFDDERTAIPSGDADALRDDLSKAIQGEVRFDKGSRALYSTDGSNYRQVPIGVVVPRQTDDVIATVNLCLGGIRKSRHCGQSGASIGGRLLAWPRLQAWGSCSALAP